MMRRFALTLQNVGIVVAVFGLSKLHAFTHGYDFTQSSRFAWSVAYAVALAIAAYGAGLPDVARGRSRVLTAAGGVVAAGTGISLAQLLVGSALLPRFVVLGAAGLAVPWLALVATATRDAEARSEERDRVVVVGTPGEVETLLIDLDRHPERRAFVVAQCQVDDAVDVTGRTEPLCNLVRDHRARLLVLTREATDSPRLINQASTLHEQGIRIRTLTDFYAQWLGKLPIAELERMSLMFDIREVHDPKYARTKRLLDLALSIPAFVMFVCAIPLVAIGNVFANRGPVFYRQSRIGRNGVAFSIMKFRTMRSAGDASPGAVTVNEWTDERDPRITPWGRILRRSHLDELPQVLNVLWGDLAIVGPRPEQPHYVAELSDKLPFYQLRHLVRPGITGWAQVKYGYAGNERDALEKLQYEFFYLGRQGLRFDLRILGRTVRSVVRSDGR